MQYTREQVLQMAPDDASAKAGQQLAGNAKWLQKHIHDLALWGDCQGSGKTPYKTMIDLRSIAFKCSCPSRKFPCKHGLGLMLLYLQQPAVFSAESELPAAVSEWLDKRAEKETAKEQKEQKPVDEAAKAKRAASREKKVQGGMEELRAWLQDVVRTGIMNVPQEAYRFSQNITARMVDAQAGGLAARLRQISRIDFYKDGWQQELIKRLALLYLITDAYDRVEQLPDNMAAELQQLIGWNVPKEEVLQQEAIQDTWTVLSLTTTEENNIRTEQVWLHGRNSNRFALLLHFYAGGQQPQHVLVPGLQLDAGMVYFPGAGQMRALIKEQRGTASAPIAVPAMSRVEQIFEQITAVLSVNPFTEQIPFLLEQISIVRQEQVWWIRDQDGQAVRLYNPDGECWRMLACCQGRPFACFGIYEQERFHIHTLWTNDKNYFIK